MERGTCGLLWDFDAIKNSDLIELMEFNKGDIDPKMMGAPVSYEITFKAVKPGVITMNEERPWNHEVVQCMTITIN